MADLSEPSRSEFPNVRIFGRPRPPLETGQNSHSSQKEPRIESVLGLRLKRKDLQRLVTCRAIDSGMGVTAAMYQRRGRTMVRKIVARPRIVRARNFQRRQRETMAGSTELKREEGGRVGLWRMPRSRTLPSSEIVGTSGIVARTRSEQA